MLLVHRCDAAEGIQRFSDFAVSYLPPRLTRALV
jgi:hypothetical protein